MKIAIKAYVYLVVSLLTGAFLPIVLTLAKGSNIFEFFMLTYLISIPFALILVRFTHSGEKLKRYLTNAKSLAVIAAIGLLTYIPIQFAILYSEQFVSVSLATAVFRTSPLLMLIFLPYVLKERLSKSQILALGLAFLGLYIALTQGTFYLPVGQSDFLIIIFLTLAALAYALGSILPKKYVFNMASSILLFNVFMFLLFAFLFVASGLQTTPVSLSLALVIIYLSIVNNIAGFYMYFTSLRMLKTTLVTNLFFLSPFITFASAFLLLGETIPPYYIAVAALVAIGIILQKFDKVGGTYLRRDRKAKEELLIHDVTGIFAETANNEISQTIENGGRVLAVKIKSAHKQLVNELAGENLSTNVFADGDEAIRGELSFLRETVGAKEDEMIVVKAGGAGEDENFFDGLFKRIKEVS